MSFEKRLNSALDEVRAIAPGAAEVRTAASGFAFPPSANSRLRIVKVGGFALAAGLAIAAVTFAPSKASALETLKQALDSVRASHTVSYTRAGEATMEYWREGVKRRYRIYMDVVKPGSNRIHDRGYDGQNVWSTGEAMLTTSSMGKSLENYAVISDEEPWGFGISGTSVEEAVKVWNASRLKGPVKVTSRSRTLDGKMLKEVVIEGEPKQGDPFRQVLQCRESDGLPTRIDFSYIIKGKEVRGGYSTIDYPDSFPKDTFEFHAPRGVRILDLRVAKRLVLAGINGRNESQTVSGVRIDLIGAFEQIGGITTVLWTGGATPHLDGKAEMAEADGQSYTIFSQFQYESEPDKSQSQDRPGVNTTENLGFNAERPVEIRPFFVLNGTPVYAMECRRNRGMFDRTLTVKIPAFKQAERRTVKYGKSGPWYSSEGQPVGSATFKVKSIPITNIYSFIEKLGIEGPTTWGSFPMTPGLDNRRDKSHSQD